jgi:hypothetical protein
MNRRLFMLPHANLVPLVSLSIDSMPQLLLFMETGAVFEDGWSAEGLSTFGDTYGSSADDGSGLSASRACTASITYSPISQSSAHPIIIRTKRIAKEFGVAAYEFRHGLRF